MILDELTYSEIEQLIDKSCRSAICYIDESQYVVSMNLYDQWNGDIITCMNSIYDSNNHVCQLICRLNVIKSVLIDMIFCLKKTKEYYRKHNTFTLHPRSACKKISIGINGMPTEYIDHGLTVKVRDLLEKIEKNNTLEGLAKDIADMLFSDPATIGNQSIIDMQLFYADIIYDNFNIIYTDIIETNKKLNVKNSNLPCISLYTWVGGDHDGIPFTTADDTDKIINSFSSSIRRKYQNEFSNILLKYNDDDRLKVVGEVLLSTQHPAVITLMLDSYDYDNYPEIYMFNLKIKSFGFHYIELEFRENSRVIHEVMDCIVNQRSVCDILSIDKPYRDLIESERELLLSHLLSNDKLPVGMIDDFLQTNSVLFIQKSNEYAGKSVYELHDMDYTYLQKFNAKRFLEWFYIIKKYPDSTNKFGIAEAKSISDALALLFFSNGILGAQTLHIVLQPEGPKGAVDLCADIEVLYQNKSYSAHLKKNNNSQYITFGPSDTCKQGGKGMHLVNMRLAKKHRSVAKRHGIELICSIVIGYEHARCNNVIVENLHEYGASEGSEIRYMLAGLNEMRHHILTPLMTKTFFKIIYDFQFLSLGINSNHSPSYDGCADFWERSVASYEKSFFNHSHLPIFLKKVARLDIVRFVTNDHRPQSRKYWLECAEIDPSQIRAIAWIRSLLLSGLHFEWIGSDSWSEKTVEFLNTKFNQDKSFFNYVKSIAYACARTNIKMTWNVLGYDMPIDFQDLISLKKSSLDDSRKFLANIHLCYLKSIRFVIKSIYGRNLKLSKIFYIDRFSLLDYWLDLSQEVIIREKSLNKYYDVVLYSIDRNDLSRNMVVLRSIYAAFISESNTAISYFLTENDRAFPSLRYGFIL